MGDKTHISWTDATWNPVVGCTRVSAGCDHCYAFALHDRRHAQNRFAFRAAGYDSGEEMRATLTRDGQGQRLPWPAQYDLPFSRVQLLPDRLDQPLRWRKPRRVFVNSMSDLFHEDVPDEYISHVFAVMAMAPQHTFQILTKRAGRQCDYLREMASDPEGYAWAWAREASNVFLDGREAPRAVETWPLPNVMLGVSVEDQATADERIPLLLKTPAAMRFVSCEPLLEAVDLSRWLGASEGVDNESIRASLFGSGSDRRVFDRRERADMAPSALDRGKPDRYGSRGAGHQSSTRRDNQAGYWPPEGAGTSRRQEDDDLRTSGGVDAHEPGRHPSGDAHQPPRWRAGQQQAEQLGASHPQREHDPCDESAGQDETRGNPQQSGETDGAAGARNPEPLRATGDAATPDRPSVRRVSEDSSGHFLPPPLEAPSLASRPKSPISLIIVGGESGPHHRPLDLAWVRSVREQCREAGVAYHGKQDAGVRPGKQLPGDLGDREWPS